MELRGCERLSSAGLIVAQSSYNRQNRAAKTGLQPSEPDCLKSPECLKFPECLKSPGKQKRRTRRRFCEGTLEGTTTSTQSRSPMLPEVLQECTWNSCCDEPTP